MKIRPTRNKSERQNHEKEKRLNADDYPNIVVPQSA